MVQLDDRTWIHFKPLPLFEYNNIIASIQNGGIGSECFDSEDTSWTNYSINFLNTDEVTLYTEGNACGVTAIPDIEITFENYYIHILNSLSKQYIYVYSVLKLIGSKVAMYSIMWLTICLLLI